MTTPENDSGQVSADELLMIRRASVAVRNLINQDPYRDTSWANWVPDYLDHLAEKHDV